jgi:hypothetical protein
MIAKSIKYFGHELILICDGKCSKAFGFNGRPKNQLSKDEDDYEYLSDDELPTAPQDPGTYEGRDAKPTSPQSRLNKWCARECERAIKMESNKWFILPDFSKRKPNYSKRQI